MAVPEKEENMKTVAHAVAALPDGCKEEFIALTQLLIDNRESQEDQKTAYMGWVGEFFQASRAGELCSYCGTAMPTTATGTQEPFCSEDHEKKFKRILWQVLDIFK